MSDKAEALRREAYGTRQNQAYQDASLRQTNILHKVLFRLRTLDRGDTTHQNIISSVRLLLENTGPPQLIHSKVTQPYGPFRQAYAILVREKHTESRMPHRKKKKR
ncbi:hypothetical protein GDO78_002546 [Eleutherodactylus coqui]|uniref:Uncharacterized protein n=1 Tax=Eleutherodactylus coqui TaxID=57060 RepID=A0A8J6K3A1_ELECQ|nr:hypothetical protein GDO78_002546 [Eleutherodactylus coqui]